MLKDGVAVRPPAPRAGRVGPGTTVPFAGLNAPGTYVCNWNGQLLRIPVRTSVPADSLCIRAGTHGPLLVTMLSHDPAISVPRARQLADSLGLAPAF